jgi:hypothetical protein
VPLKKGKSKKVISENIATEMKTLNHTLIALAIQLSVWLVTGSLVYGALIAVAYFYGREFAQAEYRYMSKHNTNRSSMPWYAGFDYRNWTYDAMVNDLLFPVAAVSLVVYLGG